MGWLVLLACAVAFMFIALAGATYRVSLSPGDNRRPMPGMVVHHE